MKTQASMMRCLMACACTPAVSVMGRLDLQSGETSISVELAVVPVGLTIAATY